MDSAAQGDQGKAIGNGSPFSYNLSMY